MGGCIYTNMTRCNRRPLQRWYGEKRGREGNIYITRRRQKTEDGDRRQSVGKKRKEYVQENRRSTQNERIEESDGSTVGKVLPAGGRTRVQCTSGNIYYQQWKVRWRRWEADKKKRTEMRKCHHEKNRGKMRKVPEESKECHKKPGLILVPLAAETTFLQ